MHDIQVELEKLRLLEAECDAHFPAVSNRKPCCMPRLSKLFAGGDMNEEEPGRTETERETKVLLSAVAIVILLLIGIFAYVWLRGARG